VIYQPVTIETAEFTPRVIREDSSRSLEDHGSLMADIRNYTPHFGPQHPARMGAAAGSELDGSDQTADPTSVPHRATESGRDPHVHPVGPLHGPLDYVR